MQQVQRRLFVTALLAALCSLSAASHAACQTGLAERMSEKLHPQRPLDHQRAVCEAWRGVPGRYVVVLPLLRPGSEPNLRQYDLDVLLVQQADNGNTEHARVVSRFFEESALSEDALRISEIRLDSARYLLAPDQRAFGLRILRQGPSPSESYSDESLSLYLPQGPRLAKVLDRLELSRERGQNNGDCAADFQSARGSLSIARSSSNGLADLVLRQSESDTRSVRQGDDCQTQEEPGSYQTKLLHFDGKEYRAAKRGSAD